jgi:hypothetical protein
VPKARVAKQTGSVAKTKAAGDAHRIAEANEARGVVKTKAAEGARSGATTDTKVIKGARPVASAKAAKETGSVVKVTADSGHMAA